MPDQTAITDAEGYELTDAAGLVLAGSCADECPACGGECTQWVRFEPCGTVDCAGNKTPGSGPPLWLCASALCTNAPGTITDAPGRTVKIGDLCYRQSSPTQQVGSVDDIPPGESYLDTPEGGYECNCACGQTTGGWARAVPCDPNFNGAHVYFCKASMLRPCVITDLVAPGCHRYRTSYPDVDISNRPPGSHLVAFPPDYNYDTPPGNYGSCCRCNCGPNPPTLPPIACPGAGPLPGGGWPNRGCCNPPAARVGDYASLSYRSEQFDDGPNTFRRIITYQGFGPALAMPVTVTTQDFINDVPFNTLVEQVLIRVPCPVAEPEMLDGALVFSVFFGEGLIECGEFRDWDEWAYNQRFEPPGFPGSFRTVKSVLRLLQRDRDPCRNNDCLGTGTQIPGRPIERPGVPVILPAIEGGSDGGRITVRGGGSRQTGSVTAAGGEAAGNGCADCGDGMGAF